MPRVRTSQKKLSRKRDQRRALVRTLANNLIIYKEITTTKPKAKTLVPYVEKLITQAGKDGLASRRYVRSKLDTVQATHELVDLIAPQMKRKSGFLTLKNAGFRQGDNAQLVTVSFVDEIKDKLPKTKLEEENPKSTVKKPKVSQKVKKG